MLCKTSLQVWATSASLSSVRPYADKLLASHAVNCWGRASKWLCKSKLNIDLKTRLSQTHSNCYHTYIFHIPKYTFRLNSRYADKALHCYSYSLFVLLYRCLMFPSVHYSSLMSLFPPVVRNFPGVKLDARVNRYRRNIRTEEHRVARQVL